MDDIDHELAEARAHLVSKLYGLTDGLTVYAGMLDSAALEKAADLLPLMLGPVNDIEVAVRKLDNLLRSPADPHGGATVTPLRPHDRPRKDRS